MRARQFYRFLFTTMLVIAAASFSARAQEKLIITETDTILFNIQPDEEEYRILAEFYKKVNGKKWKKNTNWLKGKTSADMAKWHGVVVRDGDISEIHLDDNNLKGQIPKSLYKLDRLVAVSVDKNALEETTMASTAPADEQENVMMMTAVAGACPSPSAPVAAGRNLPVWGLAVDGPAVQKLDWRKTPPEATNLPSSGASKIGPSGVAIDGCGKLAFYILHSGIDKPNQLHIYSATGVRLTTTIAGDARQGLNSANSNIELQVVPVPGSADEWYIIYSLYQPPCLFYPPASSYCPAKVVYATVKYNDVDGLVMRPDKRAIRIGGTKTFTQGKAVSRTVNGDPSRHYLYLAERDISSTELINTLRLHRYIIDASGINYGEQAPNRIPAKYWEASIAGSAVELSPDEKMLALSNRNVGNQYKEDIIIFDLSKFSESTYTPITVSTPNLVVYGTGKTVKQLSTEPAYQCLQHLKNKLSQIQFSPSGRYLYMVHGGYPEFTGGVSYNTYLLQIDLQSGSGIGDYEVRMQIEKGLGMNATNVSNCTGPSGSGTLNNFTQEIQIAYDGRIYFTKRNSSTLFVIPNPDDPMCHDMVPGVIELNTPAVPNVSVAGSAKVLVMPENIDGFVYLKESSDATLFVLSSQTVGVDENMSLTVSSFDSNKRYQVSWGDGMIQAIPDGNPLTHKYLSKGTFEVTVTQVSNATQCAAKLTKTVTVLDCVEANDIIAIESTQYLCATKFSTPKIADCYATYHWDFGDGTTSTDRSPMHVYGQGGDYTVNVRVTYDCLPCRGEVTASRVVTIAISSPVLEQRTVHVPSDIRDKIISSPATTFRETWPLEHQDLALENKNPYIDGSQGVWRNEGTFVYNVPRSASTPVNTGADGTYTLNHFNWEHAELQAIPNWIKAGTMTRYNAYGFELENRDVLEIPSAALYDHGGQLQTAHGVNMRNDEIAFTGFEDLSTAPTGNLVFHNKAVPAFTYYKVNTADSYIATVEASPEDLETVEYVDIIQNWQVQYWIFSYTRSRIVQRVKILCKLPYPDPGRPDLSVIVLEKTAYEGVWSGWIRIRNTVAPVVTGNADNVVAHTGKSSLKIATEKMFEQKLIRLDAGKTYHFSAWVSTNNPHALTPKLADNLGVDVVLKDKHGSTVATIFIVPQGKIIEGWQQVKGSFTCPGEDLTLNLRFKPGSGGTAWYDDVRLHPENGNMKSYVYDTSDYRLRAILDEDNFASIFYYDKEGNLYLTKKETEEGIKTITENISYQVERQEE